MNDENSSNTSNSPAYLEPHSEHAPIRKEGFARHDSPVCIHIHSIRKRLTDPDGISAKAAIDGLVHAKILTDDSAKYVKKVSYSQEKGSQEQTIITIDSEDGNE